MRRLEVCGYSVWVEICDAIVAGSGAAGFAAAKRLRQFGVERVVVVTENIKGGTSRNTGSDKQTYYKLSLCKSDVDSVGDMAQTLYAGGAVNGDTALAEAALSVKEFLHLVELGVPFPQNRYGEFVGYKTDHDPKKRASSIGPFTSKAMTEVLEKAVMDMEIPIYNHHQIISILIQNQKLAGILCLNMERQGNKDGMFRLFLSEYIVYATGGEAGMYRDSAYPKCHHGASGIAFAAGIRGRNLTEWQYGLASLKPRWNVSGSYMQVLPVLISTNQQGENEQEFLATRMDRPSDVLNCTFLKGYQWPFDVTKAEVGSSAVDMAVYEEIHQKNRRVFLDFRKNPCGRSFSFDILSSEALSYLKNGEVLFGTPVERLIKINAPAYEFYLQKGIDLKKERLEIALCAQHNNGGLAVDGWWETNIQGVFAAGEAAGTHGVYRPGGAALNAGQVGAERAAICIARRLKKEKKQKDTRYQEVWLKEQIIPSVQLAEMAVRNQGTSPGIIYREAQDEMSRIAGPVRKRIDMEQWCVRLKDRLTCLKDQVAVTSPRQIYQVYRLYDMLTAQYVYLHSMLNYMEKGMGSRGSALYYPSEGPVNNRKENLIQEISYREGTCTCMWYEAEKIPKGDEFFEKVWRECESLN